MEYETFQRNISRGFNGPKRLYDLVSDNSNSLTESQFIDAVSRNIKKSKILVIVIGDGIKEEASILASLLQNNMHSYFTFSLVELWMGRSNNNGILVFPSVFTKTMIIERNIININGEGYSVEPLKKNLDRPVPYSIGFSDFMYSLRKLNDKLPENIEFFIPTLNEIGIYTEIKKSSLSILVELEENLIICFGYITTKGEFWTDRGPSSALKPAWRTYIETISNIIGGKIRDNLQGKIECLDERGKVPLISKFVPDNTQALISAMQRLMQDLSKDV